jgi:putative DNA methylase
LAVLDLLMGGGVMLLEAARLGADIRGVDVEPVAAVVSNFQGYLSLLSGETGCVYAAKGMS